VFEIVSLNSSVPTRRRHVRFRQNIMVVLVIQGAAEKRAIIKATVINTNAIHLNTVPELITALWSPVSLPHPVHS